MVVSSMGLVGLVFASPSPKAVAGSGATRVIAPPTARRRACRRSNASQASRTAVPSRASALRGSSEAERARIADAGRACIIGMKELATGKIHASRRRRAIAEADGSGGGSATLRVEGRLVDFPDGDDFVSSVTASSVIDLAAFSPYENARLALFVRTNIDLWRRWDRGTTVDLVLNQWRHENWRPRR